MAASSTGSASGATTWLAGEGIPRTTQRIAYTADMRYHRQGYEIPVAIEPEQIRNGGLADLGERFNQLHEQLYGFRMPGTASRDRQPARGRLRRRAEAGAPGRRARLRRTRPAPSSTSTRSIFDGERVATKIYDRAKLRAGRGLRRPGDRDGVRLDDSGAPRLRGRRSTRNFNILITPNDVSEGEMATTEELRIAEIPDVEVDPVTLDIIEGALKSARFEMDAVLFRSAMSPVIREQHDEFPMITDPRGRMVVGQFGAYINEMMAEWDGRRLPGRRDPHLRPVQVLGLDLAHERLARAACRSSSRTSWSAGRASSATRWTRAARCRGRFRPGAKTIFEEGIIIPPLKILERGVPQEDVLKLIFNNVRLPEMNRADLFAIVAGCRAGERRVIELCERFGKETYLAALQALLDRTYEAMRQLILLAIPEVPQSFEDYVDDDGLGNGPYKMKLTIWREGDQAFFDWSGTDPQALGPINFYLSEGMFKMFIGIYLIMVNDPQILFNDGFYPLLHVVMPEGSLLRPRFPAALGCRTHALARLFDVLGGALVKQAPELNTAAGYGTSPYMLYSGWDEKGDFFYSMEILYGGIPGRPIGDGMDGHSWWPLFENIPTEYLEAYYPLRIDGYTTVTDSGGAGFHRGGNGVEKRYIYLEPGEVSIHDDRWLTRPWGVLGGEPGGRSEKILRRADGTEERLPSKCDRVVVEPGDMLVFRTAGGGGWKDRLDRPAEIVARDVSYGLVSPEHARAGYGVVLAEDGTVDADATEAERTRQRDERGERAALRLRASARGRPRRV